MARHDADRPERKTLAVTIQLYPGDDQLVEWIREQIGGASRSDVIRTAIRAYALHLQAILGQAK